MRKNSKFLENDVTLFYKTKDAKHSLCSAFNPIVVSMRNKWDEEISQFVLK